MWFRSLGGEFTYEDAISWRRKWQNPFQENSVNRDAWWATSIGLQRVRHDSARPHVACTWRSTGWIFYRMSLSEGLSDNLLLIKMGSSVECHSYCIMSRVPTICLTCHYLTLVLILAEDVFVRCPHSKITLPSHLSPLPRLPHSWKELTTVGSYSSTP